MAFSALAGRYNDSVFVDLVECLDPEENQWTVAIIDLVRVGAVSDGLYMAAVFAPGRLIHRAAPVWSLEEAQALYNQFFTEITSGTFLPINYTIKPLEPLTEDTAPEEEADAQEGEQ